jgi:ubiquinone/menaquinone biosynthesis C-methylase UbiE
MAFEQLKERQSFVWGNAPFEEIADTIADVHRGVVDALQPAEGKHWLEVACGTGELAELAAASGADVVGVDFAAPLVETAKRRAVERGLDIDYRVGDAENLEFEDASFDIVSSTFGVMFAPNHEAAAAELARVTRSGGRLGLATWNPEGGIGQMFKVMAQFQPPPPEGVGSPLDWGRPEHVHALLGEAFDVQVEERESTFEQPSAEEYWTRFSPAFGPVKTLLETLDEDGRENVHRTFVGWLEDNFGTPGGSIVHRREYLLIRGTRKGAS